MVNKIIAEYLKTNKRLVIPQFGAFIHKDSDGTVAFVPFLRKDDGVLTQLICANYGVNPDEAQLITANFISEIKESISIRGTYIIEHIGQLMLDTNGIYYITTDPAQVTPITPVTPPAPQPAPTVPPAPVQQRPVVQAPQPVQTAPPQQPRPTIQAQPQPVATPKPQAPQPMQQRVQQQPQRFQQQASPEPAPRPMSYPPHTPPQHTGQPLRSPIPDGRRPMSQQPGRPGQPGQPRRQPPMGRPKQKRTKTDGFIVIAILAAAIALAVMIFGFFVGGEGPKLAPIIPTQTQSAPAPSTPTPAPVTK